MARRPTIESSKRLSPHAVLAASRKASAAIDAKYQQTDMFAERQADIARLGRTVCRVLTGYAEVPAGLPRPLADVLQRAIAPDKPYQSATDFHAALSKAIHQIPPDQRTRRLVLRPQIGNNRKPWLVLGAAGLIGLLLLGCFAYVGLAIPAPPILTATALALLPTNTPYPTDTATPTATATFTPSSTPTATSTSTPTSTDTPTTTFTPTATDTFTRAPTVTSPPSETSIPSVTPMTPSVITATAASTATPIVAAVSVVNPCVVVVGDSVAHGGMVFEIPATGYVHGTSSPLSQFVDQELKKAGLTDLRGVDRAVSNTGISSRNHYSYFRTASYQNLLTDHCKYTIMLPWVNDITSDWPASYAAPHHVAALVRFVGELADGNPGGRILVLNYYRPVLAPFALQTWARGFIPENIDAYNHEIELSCQYGTFSKLPQVVCIHMNDAFTEMGDDYVIAWASRDELNTDLIYPIPDDQKALLQQYYEVHPDGLVLGDGVHLSTMGKSALAAYLVSVIRSLPDMPAKVH